MSDAAPTTAATDPTSTSEPRDDRRVDALTHEVVAAWMAGQRWYAAKGLDPALRLIAALEGEVDGVRVSTQLVIDDAPSTPVLYQVPLTVRTEPVDALDEVLIATDGERWLYDGPHDAAYARWLLGTIDGGATVQADGASVEGQHLADIGAVTAVRVLRGEQSNTSVICDVDGGGGQVIVKVFRVLHHGDNPDVTSQAALSAGGSTRVPRSFGALRGTWPDVGRDEGTATGHLAFAQEFLPGLEDAWRVALQAAQDGVDFTEQAHGLGQATAEVHAVLAEQLPTVAAGADEIASAVGSMRQRLEVASDEVPAVAEHADAIRRIYDAAEGLEWPRLQRIHGDLHLGQAVSSPDRGWVLLDFEGEPLRPMPERSRPDVTLRDVAGMLRSFDYVAGALQHGDNPTDASGWAHDARRAFVDGYIAASGTDIRAQRTLLDAFEIDKAVYEAVYEARNRPDWIGIPIAAVARLVERSAPDAA
ncbi:phosphotransferase [Curtobacterium sp. MCBD17_003]|uniref:maltokinase N-terminal cap-like domain-containing protein n=1 Tax=Curtobacterium sp. MCBD17_003 TaxID=2175667 RepID=UPI0015E8B605|nr:phosphotransferase [Curtobacterium sp. MCBD17_003]WIE54135.1 phosphotransferase [Curtobacterium sp. MCBD17_003]